ncbi:hypothetical protein EC82524_3662A, partial [Escherichia coli 8.2524]
MQQRILFL